MTPRLSVVVPVYNVDIYLEECLASLAAQTVRELDVVMVDDGSTDGSVAIAERFAAEDPRFRLVRQENKGLGAARNTGVRHLAPDTAYLAFVDSDDVVLPDAYERLLGSLEETGSDLASGNVLSLRSAGTSQSAMHRTAFARTQLRTHISRAHELVADRTAWNKVFRRSFWEREGFAFPEGVLFEDAPLTLPAHFAAKSVDILADPVYLWRVREAGKPSITQDRTNPAGVRDRMAAIDSVSRYLADHPEHRGQKDWYDENALDTEVPLYLAVLPASGPEFRRELGDALRDFLTRVSPGVLARLRTSNRVKIHLVAQGRAEEAAALRGWERANPQSMPVRGFARFHADYPGLADLPREVLRVDRDLSARARLNRVDWTDRGLRVSGHAYIRYLDSDRPGASRRALVVQGGGSRRPLLLPVRTGYSPEATAASGQALHNYDWSGFEAVLDPMKLRRKGRWRPGVYQVTAAVLNRGRVARTRIKAGALGAAPALPPRSYEDGRFRVVPYLAEDHLYLRVEEVLARVTGHRAQGGDVLLTARLVPDAAAEAAGKDVAVRLTARHGTGVLDLPAELSGDLLTVLVPAGKLDAADAERADRRSSVTSDWHYEAWTAELVLPGRAATPLLLDGSAPGTVYPRPGGARTRAQLGADYPDALTVTGGTDGRLTVHNGPARPLAVAVGWTDDDRIELSGVHPAPEGELELVLRHSRQAEEHAFPVERDGTGFHTVFLPAPRSLAGEVPLRWGNWFAFLRPVGAADPGRYAPVLLDTPLHDALPLPAVVRGKTLAVDRRYADRLMVEAEPAVTVADRGSYHQRKLREDAYPAARELPLRDAVLYDTFSGRQASDSPLAVFRELRRQGAPLEHLWVVRDQQAEVPEGATAIVIESRAWYEALATSRYLVVNSHQQPWLRRREGQVVVQTWHGTPLKRIAHDIDSVQFADPEYLDKVAEETPHWSFLVSPNTFSTPILRRAFRFEGEILESGYPRNDLLHADDREKRAAEVRERIGVPEGKKVVLYAPTWRDDQFYGQGRYKLDFRIDVPEAAAALAGDHVLLVRKHANIVDTVPGAGDGFVFDVSSYPDITELFLISDVLVTDYSSLMFDFAATGRPMLFYTYDLEHYRGNLRGFYFDFEAQAPGPLIPTSAELIAAIMDAEKVAVKYADAYAAFRSTFCDLDDGHAAERVIARMYELSSGD